MNEVPTLMVGLGGIGSGIVNRVYDMIPEERRSRIAAHIFDTNVNDISKLIALDKEWRTQTSKDLTVEQYINNLDESEEYVKDWFPYEEREIRRKSLTEGAGQVRAISRLAYRASMQEGKLNNLHRQLTSIFREVGEAAIKSARVMIVSTLAGGTGGGIFLQTAMYLREVLKNHYNRSNVLIRGAFLLPDILALTGTVSPGEVENIRANAYACLKELNAITKNASSSERATDNVEIELEYHPNQTDSSGRLNHVVTSDQLPYDFCFLYDFENTAKNNLQYVENYLNQAAQSIFLELFSPMADDKFSRQDNQILDLVRSRGLNRYCGAGVAKLIYPYDKNIKYFALKWATDSLSNDWLRIDGDFDKEYRQFENDLQNGVNRDEPKLSERYVWLLDNLASDENPKPFFKFAYRDAHISNKKGEPETPKFLLFLNAVENEIEEIIKKDPRLNQIQSECDIDETRLSDKDRMLNEVIQVEEALIFFENEINKFVRESKTFIVNQIFWQDCDARRFIHGKDYQLNTWMLKKDEPVHPVTVRYILYQILNAVTRRLNEMVDDNIYLAQSIDRYKQAYDLPETEDIVEDAQERVRKALKQSFWGKVYRNELKEFSEEFFDKASRQKSNLVKYKKQKLQELVLTDVKKHVREMLDDWERYFRNLRGIRNSLQQDLNKLAQEELRAGDPTMKYVLASAEMKENLWRETRRFLGSSALPSEISEQIYMGQYNRVCARRKNEYLKDSSEKVEIMFRKDVVQWCEKELRKQDALKMNCIEAIRKEAKFQGLNAGKAEKMVREMIKSMDNLSRPFVPYSSDANNIDLWGINPECVNELTGDQRNDWFGTELIEDIAFPEYEITRYKSIFNLSIGDFSKFYSGDQSKGLPAGEYFKAYTNRIKQLTTLKNTVTPHLDKRWHVPAFLPDLNPQVAKEQAGMIDRVLLIGIIIGALRSVDIYGDKTWELFEGKNSRLIKIGDKMAGKFTFSLHNALRHNPVVVDKVMQLFDRQREKDKNRHADTLEEHLFCKGAQAIYYQPIGKKINILDIILKYSSDYPSDESLQEKETDLLDILLDEIFSYFKHCMGKHKMGLVRDEFVAFIDLLKQGSKVYGEADRNGRLFQKWEAVIDTKIENIQEQ